MWIVDIVRVIQSPGEIARAVVGMIPPGVPVPGVCSGDNSLTPFLLLPEWVDCLGS